MIFPVQKFNYKKMARFNIGEVMNPADILCSILGEQFIDITPHPPFTRFGGGDNRMSRRFKMFGGVLVR